MLSSLGNKLFLIVLCCGLSLSIQAQQLRSPESIVWDDYNGRYLISNTVDAGIRSVDTEGRIEDFGYLSKGSHGLQLIGKMLYACYRNEIKCYDTSTEQLLDSYTVPGAKFLNGITTDGEGILYLSDFSERTIYRVMMNEAEGRPVASEAWHSMDLIPNGIAYDVLRDELVVVTWGSRGMIFCIDRQTGEVKHEIESGYGNLESILIDESGDAYVSAWSPSAILKFEQGVRTSPSIWDAGDVFRPTGLVFDQSGELLFISSDGRNVHGLKSNSSFSNSIRLDAFPNPVSVNSLITYNVDESGFVNISVYDSRGNLVQTLLKEDKKAGKHHFIYEREDRASGLYFINIQSGGSSDAIAVTLVD